MNRKRLEAELVRDSVLAVSVIESTLGGKPIRVPSTGRSTTHLHRRRRDGLWPVTPGENDNTAQFVLLNKRTVRLP